MLILPPYILVDKCYATAYSPSVKIWNFARKGLKLSYIDDHVKTVPPDTADKVRKMWAFLDDRSDTEELSGACVGDVALSIEKAFGVKRDTLMRMQASYDIA